MYRIALNTAISYFRKEKRDKPEHLNSISFAIPDEKDDNEKTEKINLVHQALNKLNKAERSIMILYMDDYSYDDISEIIGISVSNAGVKINRIKKKLQVILKELGYEF